MQELAVRSLSSSPLQSVSTPSSRTGILKSGPQAVDYQAEESFSSTTDLEGQISVYLFYDHSALSRSCVALDRKLR